MRRPASWRILLAAFILVSFSLLFSVACGGGGTQGPGQEKASSNLTAAGSTFVAPFFNKVFQQYASDTGTQVNYQSIGSGGGVTQFIDKTIDFGASDAPMSDAELAKAKGRGLNE